MRQVIIEWRDAETLGDSNWQDQGEAQDFAETPPPLMKTMGFVLYECSEWIAVTDSIGPNQYGHVTKIPFHMILNVQDA